MVSDATAAPLARISAAEHSSGFDPTCREGHERSNFRWEICMPTAEERLAILEEVLTEAAGKGLLQLAPDDGVLDGRTLSFDGREVVSFGSCSYLGLELDPRLKQATI